MERQVFGGELHSGRPARPIWNAMLNGMRGRCPQCGEGRLFRSFSKTVPVCEHCGLEIHHHRADDFPAYIVILIVGHITIGGMLAVEITTNLPMWMHLAIWAPLTVILAIGLLQPVKGAIVGLQWALYMHGFGGEEPALETHPDL
jgi:uncharacterized protein (DUF983 family)